MDDASRQASSRRRSLRIVMRVPLLVNVLNGPQTTDWEHVDTLVISLHGGLIRTRQSFPAGAMLELRMCLNDRSALARVVWEGPEGNGKGHEVGFETLEPGFWDVKFPPDRWHSPR